MESGESMENENDKCLIRPARIQNEYRNCHKKTKQPKLFMNKIRIAVWLGLALCCSMVGEMRAFYNPQTGRWLSRDPVEEKGGLNNYEFIANNSITGTDFLGLLLWPTKSDKCCCDGRQITNVRLKLVASFKYRESDWGGSKFHMWVKWGRSTIDSNSIEMQPVFDLNDPRRYKISFPAGYIGAPEKTEEYDSVSLSTCEYDFEKFYLCLSEEAERLNGERGDECGVFAANFLRDQVGFCKAKSKGCTSSLRWDFYGVK